MVMTIQAARAWAGPLKRVLQAVSWLLAATASAAMAGTSLVWETDGFQAPESVCHDAARGVLYVSNVNGSPTEKNGQGYLSRLSSGGQVLQKKWVTGLNAPKGMAVVGDRLYVSDIDALVEIDIGRGEVIARYRAPGAKFLNDVTADGAGNVYVSDMMDDAIYRLASGRFALWIKDPKLNSPNGLYVQGDRLVVASWGQRTKGFETDIPGHLLSVSLADGHVGDLGSGMPVGNLDGIEADSRGSYLVTDWMNGALYRINAKGDPRLLMDLPQGSADLAYIRSQGIAVIPMMNDGLVRAYLIH